MALSWIDELNPAQREAVTHDGGPLLVIAGAGTGKTKTLACRVAYLIDAGVPPDRILLLTFTRRAAGEMISRAERLTGRAAAAQVWGGTFHAVAHRLLRMYGAALGLAPDFTVMDEGDACDLINLVRNECGAAARGRRFPRKETLRAIHSRTLNAREKLSVTLESRFPWCRADSDAVREVFERYTERKRAQQLLDFDDLLLYWNVLCATPGVGERMCTRFEHVLVDEYQDTNAIQAEILRNLRRNSGRIMVVGDDAQSIYSFRAATVRNILDFPKHFEGTRVVTLEHNYRSTQPILAASNAIMDRAHERYTKQLYSQRRSEQKPVLITCQDESEQCLRVCENVLAHLEQGTPLVRQGVLFRTGHHSDYLEVELTRRNIPFHKYGGLKFIEAAHIKDLLALLRILENPHDEVSWFRILQLFEGIGARGARRMLESLGVRREPGPDGRPAGQSPVERLLLAPPTPPRPAREAFEQLRRALGDCLGFDTTATPPVRRGDPLSVAGQVERLRSCYEPLLEQAYDNPRVRMADLEQLEHIALRYRSRAQFIADLTLDPPSSTSDLAQPPHLEEDYLTLSTIHSAKGCEWDVVHIIHAADGMIPSDMAISDADGVEEERRLLYVAMTRARDHLYVYFPLRYYHRRGGLSDAHSYAQISRFLAEPVREHFERRSPNPGLPPDEPVETSVQRMDLAIRDLWRD